MQIFLDAMADDPPTAESMLTVAVKSNLLHSVSGRQVLSIENCQAAVNVCQVGC